ncbi:MFS transporter [Cohnella caldifontis]|uniref:MFS transporter n=1 Tax=Cohnella caldifontis TaxID=3027471 RepID=UPI0023ED67AF|nr:MFS transporter [Cohnella sp. YIM B05605]
MKNWIAIYLLGMGAFLVGTAELVVAGILPAIAADLHISVALAGQLTSAYSLPYAIGTPLLVLATSRMDRKKLLAAALAVFVLGCAASFASRSFGVMIAARVILGLSAGVFSVAAVSSIAKLAPPGKIGRAVGVTALGFGSAMALGVPIGVAVSGWWGWQANFAMLGVLSLAVLGGLGRLLPRIDGDVSMRFKEQVFVLRQPSIAYGLTLSLLLNMGNSVMLTYVSPFLQSVLFLSTAGTGAMMLALGLAGIVGSRLGGFAIDRWGNVRVIAASLGAMIVSLGMLPWSRTPVFAGEGWMIVWFIALFTYAPALQTYFIRKAPESSNFVLSVNLSVVHLGIALGAGAGGIAIEAFSTALYHPWIAGGLAALALAAAVLSFASGRLPAKAGLETESRP